jgi:N-acetylglucosamine-6-phosphate deacetylase
VIVSGDILAGGRCEPGWVAIEGDAIGGVGAGTPPKPPDLDHDGIVSPGLVDLQVNGGEGVQAIGGDPALDVLDARQLRHGVTSYLPTVITTEPDAATRALDAIGERALDAASPVAGAHLEGPFLSPDHRGAHRLELLATPADGIPAYYAHPAVRLVTLAPELPGALELIRSLTQRGVAVSIGHSAAGAAVAEAAVACGASLVTHVFNAMARFHHRDPGLAGWALSCDAVAPCVIADGTHLAPATLELVRRAAEERAILVGDSSVAAGAAPGTYEQAGVEVSLDHEGRATTADGALAGASIALDECVRRWASITNVGLAAALMAASARPAQAIGLPGELRPGAPADLVLIASDGAVAQTMRAGRWA